MIRITILLLSLLAFSNFGYANFLTDSLSRELNKTSVDTVKIQILLKLFEASRPDRKRCFEIANEVNKISEKIKSNYWLTEGFAAMARWYMYDSKDHDSTLIVYNKLYSRMQKDNYLSGMARAWRGIGVYYANQMVDSAIYYDIKSIELYKRAMDLEGANLVKGNLAIIFANLGRIDEAIEIAEELIVYHAAKGNDHYEAMQHMNAGIYCAQANKMERAIYHFKKNIEYRSSTNDNLGVADGLINLGGLYQMQKDYNKAEKTYFQALNYLEKVQEPNYFLVCYTRLAQHFLSINQNLKAIEYGLKALNIPLNQDKYRLINVYDALFNAYKNTGNYQKAFYFLNLYKATNDSLAGVERLKRFDELEAKYQNKEKQTQIELLNKEKKIDQAVVEKQKLIRNMTIGAFIALILFGYLLFNRLKLKKKIENQLAIINERKRISSELHDDLGAQLSTARILLNNINTSGNASQKNILIENSLSIIDSSIHDLRSIMDELHTSTLQEKGYITATEELVNKINHLQLINFTLTHHGINKRFESKIEHNLFRITQELINNTLKYAHSKSVSLDLVKREDKIALIYEDDGLGFDIKNIKRGKGLTNIESRTISLGGTVEFDSSVGKGFRAVVEIPI